MDDDDTLRHQLDAIVRHAEPQQFIGEYARHVAWLAAAQQGEFLLDDHAVEMHRFNGRANKRAKLDIVDFGCAVRRDLIGAAGLDEHRGIGTLFYMADTVLILLGA